MSFAANPRAPKGDKIDESTGPVASDSLAAESVRSGGGFAENSNPDVQPVKGSQSTFANEDTTNATVIPPASSASEREGMTEQKPYDPSDKPALSGVTNQEGYTGGAHAPVSTDDAPSSYASAAGSSADSKPKGDNITEDNDLKANPDPLGDVDGRNNPSRLAEKQMLKDATDNSAGDVRDKTDVNSGTQYDTLNSSENA